MRRRRAAANSRASCSSTRISRRCSAAWAVILRNGRRRNCSPAPLGRWCARKTIRRKRTCLFLKHAAWRLSRFPR
jgi:hypothetical protein